MIKDKVICIFVFIDLYSIYFELYLNEPCAFSPGLDKTITRYNFDNPIPSPCIFDTNLMRRFVEFFVQEWFINRWKEGIICGDDDG